MVSARIRIRWPSPPSAPMTTIGNQSSGAIVCQKKGTTAVSIAVPTQARWNSMANGRLARRAAHLAREDLVQGEPQRRDQRQGERPMGHAEAGPDHDQHADEAYNHRAPAPPADALTEQRDREYRDQERCGEGDRVGVGKRNEADRRKHENRRDPRAEGRARCSMPSRVVRTRPITPTRGISSSIQRAERNSAPRPPAAPDSAP